MPENQTVWNSNNHRIKETVKQNNQTGKAVDGEKLWWGGGLWGWGGLQWGGGLCGRSWLKGKLILRGGCGLWWLLRWEKLPVSHKSSLKSDLETSRWAALFHLWPLPHRQCHSAARFALLGWILKALTPYNLSGAPSKEIGPKWKNSAKPQKES